MYINVNGLNIGLTYVDNDQLNPKITCSTSINIT